MPLLQTESYGKQYDGEKAVISLTSWKARINTLPKTLFSLVSNCKGYHIVLVLSSDEFPTKEKELPPEVNIFVSNKLIELLWIDKNYKSFKKWVVAMDKYRTVPIITADDDCIYTVNFAETLYKQWNKRTSVVISRVSTRMADYWLGSGAATLYPPYAFGDLPVRSLEYILKTKCYEDDAYVSAILKLKSMWIERCDFNETDILFHDEYYPMSAHGYQSKHNADTFYNLLINKIVPTTTPTNEKTNEKCENQQDYIHSSISPNKINNRYRCSGKLYNGENAIISLTTWKARIYTVAKTLFSLIKHCPNYHIVLVLSTEEFPQLERELPKILTAFVNKKLIEILWVKKNYKSFKKILFTMNKYPTLPIISADDDCIYTYNYADALYNKWLQNKKSICTYKLFKYYKLRFQHGPAAIYPPNCFGDSGIQNLNDNILKTYHDDVYYGILALKRKISIVEVNKDVPYIFHDCIKAMSTTITRPIEEAIRVCMANIKE